LSLIPQSNRNIEKKKYNQIKIMNSNKIENTNLAKQTTVSPLSNESSKPLIFTKKVNDKYKIIPLKANPNTLGLPRHFPPANKE
jgi:hypothetical protein